MMWEYNFQDLLLWQLVIKILQGEENISFKLGHPCIIVAEKIDPNLLAEFEPNNLLGLISSKGGVTDHTSIIAKALGIPYLLGVKNSTKIIKNGDIIIIDTKTAKIIGLFAFWYKFSFTFLNKYSNPVDGETSKLIYKLL